MFKRFVIISIVLCLTTTPVYAHLTGAFAEFLAVVYDKNTMEKLQQQMQETQKEIEALTPEIEQAEQQFTANQQLAIEQLQFFADVGLDTSLAFIEQGVDIVDLLGSKWLMEYKIDNYLTDLNTLFLQYEQLKLQQKTMQGHTELLAAIETSLAAREAYLQAAEGLDLETIANYLDIDWTSEVEYELIADLQRDHDIIQEELVNWFTFSNGRNELHEDWLNERSNAVYYFRQDHLYIEYKVNAEHVLLLGQVLQKDDQSVQLVIEAGFYNGFYLPEELLVELQGFTLSYDTITAVSQIEAPYIVQQNGRLQIQGK